MVIGELSKLISEGHLKGDFNYVSENNEEYRFTYRTLTPIEEVHAERDAKDFYDKDKITRETDMLVYRVNEVLARSLLSVNGVDLGNIPGAVGNTDLDKKRSIVKQLNQKIILNLWKEYNKLLEKTLPESTPEEVIEIKK